jgi:predicted phage terminase large subunit-like protein
LLTEDLLANSGINLTELESYHKTLLAELSLHEFLKQAWMYIEGADVPFIDGWHIKAICEHLEAVANRQIKRLLINIPYRCCKSTILAVAFPAWLWIHKPTERFIFASYARSLSSRDSRKCRQLILSPWYQERWGSRFILEKDQNTKLAFVNNRHGYRVATSVGAAVTGEGGNILIADDPNNVKDRGSKIKIESTLDWFKEVFLTRLNNQKNDCVVVVQQRMDPLDVSGNIISNDLDNEWHKLILPMEFEEARKARTIILPSTKGIIWEDPRQREKELLWPERIDEKTLANMKRSLGSSAAIAGQLQQSPYPPGGNIIKKEWFQWWKSRELPKIEFVLQSWDTAFSKKEGSSYSACTTWGVFYDHNYLANVILLSVWRERVEYPELREVAKRLFYDYRDTGKIHNPAFTGMHLDMCVIEAKATGDPLIRDLNLAGVRAIPYDPKKQGSKTQRVNFITPLIEGGLIWLRAQPPLYDRLLPWADEFMEGVASFTGNDASNEYADVIDSMSQALSKLKEGYLSHPRDERFVPPTPKEIKMY